MQDITTPNTTALARALWFANFVTYLKIRTLGLPSVCALDDFERRWPEIFDVCCEQMTALAVSALRKEVPLCGN